MDADKIQAKFGGDYLADDRTYILGIDRRFTVHLASRFMGRNVLETCTGAGFTTISLAKVAAHVWTVDIEPVHQKQAIENVKRAGCSERVSFIEGDVMSDVLGPATWEIDAAFLDPDWAVTGPSHVYRFINSNTRPPADKLIKHVFEITNNVALVLPPFIDLNETSSLPEHECESLFLDNNHELYCLYFGELCRIAGKTEYRAPV